MHNDDYDKQIARHLNEIRIPAGAEERARDAVTRTSKPPPDTPSRGRRSVAGILAVAALLVVAATTVGVTAVWQTWSADSEAPLPAAYRELQQRLAGESDLPIQGRRLTGVEYQGEHFDAWIARGQIGPQIVVTGPGLVGEVRPECPSPWNWDGAARGDRRATAPSIGPTPHGGLIVYCGASGNPTRATGHVIASVAPSVTSAELVARNGKAYPTAVDNGALLAVFPFTACDAQATPDALILKDSAGQTLLRLDQDAPESPRYLPARSICT